MRPARQCTAPSRQYLTTGPSADSVIVSVRESLSEPRTFVCPGNASTSPGMARPIEEVRHAGLYLGLRRAAAHPPDISRFRPLTPKHGLGPASSRPECLRTRRDAVRPASNPDAERVLGIQRRFGHLRIIHPLVGQRTPRAPRNRSSLRLRNPGRTDPRRLPRPPRVPEPWMRQSWPSDSPESR